MNKHHTLPTVFVVVEVLHDPYKYEYIQGIFDNQVAADDYCAELNKALNSPTSHKMTPYNKMGHYYAVKEYLLQA